MDYLQVINYLQLITLLLGAAVGLLMGLTGAGGGILSVPLLIFALDLQIYQAGPIALAAVALSASIGAVMGLRAHTLRYKAALLMGLFGLMFSPIGLWLSHQIPNTPLQLGFGLVLLLVSSHRILQIYHAHKGIIPIRSAPPCQLNQSISRLIWTVPCARALIGSGASAGLLSGLLGVGGGFIIVPALKKYTDLPMTSIVATSLGVLTIVSVGSTLLASMANTIPWAIATPFIFGSGLGLIMGRHLSKKWESARIELLFAVLSMLVSFSLLYKSIFHGIDTMNIIIAWAQFTPIASLIGGVLIGLSAVILIATRGRILGISGMIGGLMQFNNTPKGHYSWRIAFILGVMSASFFYQLWMTAPESRIDTDYIPLVLAGLLVGFGTRMGSGCTSGHAVCGLSRLSTRSLIATLSFMASGFIVAYVYYHLR